MGNMRRYGAPGNPETDEGREQRSGLIILQRSKTLADCLWQLQQHFERWPFRVELEQPTFERQDEHRLLLRLSF